MEEIDEQLYSESAQGLVIDNGGSMMKAGFSGFLSFSIFSSNFFFD